MLHVDSNSIPDGLVWSPETVKGHKVLLLLLQGTQSSGTSSTPALQAALPWS